MTQASNQRKVKVFRYDPTIGGEGHFDEFKLNIEEETKTTILDILLQIQKEKDTSLSFRYACRVNMCGSCAMVINGCERLACKTNVCDLPSHSEIVIRPLNHFPVIKDLVVDMDPFFEQYEQALPFFDPAMETDEPAIIRPDSKERMDIDLATECIQCGCCVSSCTMVNYHKEYVGPGALNRAFTLLADSRDGLFNTRLNQVLESCYNCRTEFNCTSVCPKEISPTRAIKYIQRMALKNLSHFKSEVPAVRDQETVACEKAPAVFDLSAKAHHLDNPDRRCFLKQITWGLSAASALAVGGVLATAAIGPSLQKSPETWVPLGRMEDFRPGKVTTVTMRYEVKSGFHKSQEVKPVMIARRPDVNNVVVFNTTCTHLGCTVHWDESKQLYLCACHGGIFDADGHVSAGPPPRPLDHHVFKVENGYLFVGVM